jgi:hypothetical protein
MPASITTLPTIAKRNQVEEKADLFVTIQTRRAFLELFTYMAFDREHKLIKLHLFVTAKR